MRVVIRILLFLLTAAAAYQLYQLYNQQMILKSKVGKLEDQTASLAKENTETKENLDYYQNPENLAKEFKSKFDYKRPGEELYIIVPKR